jgi:outer membrane immunogenic protein
MKAPAMPPIQFYSWTGFYIGANVGWGWSNGDGTITFGPGSGPFSGKGDGVLGGVQAGYNWQAGSWVVGVETDIQATDGHASTSGAAGATIFSGTLKAPWFGTIRGRLGYAFDRTLLYATGGAAYGKLKHTGTSSTLGAFSVSENYWTWTVGGGIEQGLGDRWSVKLEYLFVGTPATFPAPPLTAVDGEIDNHIVRAGLNYRF